MKNLKLNESLENSKVIFISLLPDDYHGAPEISTIFPTGSSFDTFPTIPTKDEVFSAWSSAGYNAFQMGAEEDDDEYNFFELYGNMDLYYAIYLITIDPSKQDIIMSDIKDELDEATLDQENMSPENFVTLLNNIAGITSACVLIK